MRTWEGRLKPRSRLAMLLRRAYRHSELRKLFLWLKGKTLHWALYLAVASLVAGGALALHHYRQSFNYVVYVGEREVGLVREAAPIEGFIQSLSEQCSALYGLPVQPAEAVLLVREYRPGATADADAVKEALRGYLTMVTEATMVTVDGVPVVPVGSMDEVETIVELLCQAYVSRAGNVVLLEVELVEEAVDPLQFFSP